ncbi:MAG: cytochrome c peroxidase [Saprospiraceae bacterium]|jgi:cytochrome c peroxidase
MASCASDSEEGLDKEVRFAINTAQGSRGLDFYKFPSKDDLHSIPQDPKNQITVAKVRLGQQLFHESGFATLGSFPELAGTYSCASCHHADGGFQANMIQGIGDGGIGFGEFGEGRMPDRVIEMDKIDVQPLRTPSVLNIAYQTNLLWNGQFGATAINESTNHLWPDNTPIAKNRLGFEGVETQAIAGLTVHRHKVDRTAIEGLGYKEMFDAAFSNMPEAQRYNEVQAGLAIAAYERTLLATAAPFQRWLYGDHNEMTVAQKEGAILFFGKGQCTTCHNGPGLAKMEFHGIGLNDFNPNEAFNFDPADPANLGRGSFTKNASDNYKFKVPQLYNLKDSPFFGHGSSFTSVRAIIAYKNQGIAENDKVPTEQLSPLFEPLNLSEEEIDLLTHFVKEALYDPNLKRYEPSSIVSGNCFPNNDWASKADLDCE